MDDQNKRISKIMNIEMCDYYEPNKKVLDRSCKYFTGDKDNAGHIGRCRRHCRLMESKELMEEGQVFKRVKGALRKR